MKQPAKRPTILAKEVKRLRMSTEHLSSKATLNTKLPRAISCNFDK